MLGAVGWALVLIARVERTFALGLAAVFSVLFVHSLLYAGFFEDPLTWGAIGLTAALLARLLVRVEEPGPEPEAPPSAPGAAGTLNRRSAARRPLRSCRKPSPGSSLR